MRCDRCGKEDLKHIFYIGGQQLCVECRNGHNQDVADDDATDALRELTESLLHSADAGILIYSGATPSRPEAVQRIRRAISRALKVLADKDLSR
jgi:hypothetical protein